ncbi:MAG: cobalamin-dependent protein [Clostridia bacterium]|nr:cobalamin-dependent protein [Clostridia bacterium]
MKKNVYLVQVNVTYSDFIAYLPYAAGCIQAYAEKDEDIRRAYRFGDILYMRKTIDEAMEDISDPYLVGFSCYVWNMEYNLALARRIKQTYPSCLTVFGGHNIPFNAEILDREPCVDYLMHGEGEVNFVRLLKTLDRADPSGSGEPAQDPLLGLTDLSLRVGGRGTTLPAGKCAVSLDDMPSPYTAGLFDRMLEEYPTVQFQGTLETNRGCPYDCAFCDWCFTERIRKFPIEKIKSEIKWMSDHRIPYCYCADANFGIFPRDYEIAEYVVERNKATGYPKIFKPCYAKNSDERVFSIGRLLNDNGVDKGVTLAYQSMSPEVLRNIGRQNLDIEYFTNLNARYTEAGIPTYTELILGLPGETYDSFCSGLCGLLEAGQHNSMTVYTCQVYCNSPLAQKDFREKFGIRWERQKLHGIHYPANFNGVQEYYDVVVETKDMSKADWVRANMFSVCLQSCHHLGLLRCFALYARYELDIPYFDFYDRLLSYIFSRKDTYTCRLYESIRQKTEDTEHSDWCYQNDIFSKVGWYFEEGVFLDLAYNIGEWRKDIRPFVDSLGIDADVLSALFDYQQAILRFPGQRTVTVDSPYDFYHYFNNIYDDAYAPLEKTPNRLMITVEKEIDDWATYAREIIWYGKRRSATLLTNPRESIVFTPLGAEDEP